jgi:hypothetical protein
LKYLGNLNEIYSINHADSTGKIMLNLHIKVKEIIKSLENININNIVEVGSAKGILSDLILDENIVSKYYIIEPNYFGSKRQNKIIINDYLENVNFNNYKDCNTLLISHVFEHFYNPMEILTVLEKNNYIRVFEKIEFNEKLTKQTIDNFEIIDEYKDYLIIKFKVTAKEIYLKFNDNLYKLINKSI